MRSISVLGTVLLAATIAGPANAEGEAPAPMPARILREHGELAATGGYTTAPVRLGATPLGLGGGAKLGYVFASGVYLGARVLGFLGSQDVDVTSRSVMYGAQLGYGFRAQTGEASAFIVRPMIGVGGLTVFRIEPGGGGEGGEESEGPRRRNVDTVSGASGQGGGTTGVTGFYVEPALGVIYGSDATFIGASAGALFVPSIQGGGSTPSQWLAYTFSLDLGLMF